MEQQELAEATHQTSVCAWVPLLQHAPALLRGAPCREREKSRLKTEPAGLILKFLLQQLEIGLHRQNGSDGHRAERRLCLTPALAPPPPASPSVKMTAASISWRKM